MSSIATQPPVAYQPRHARVRITRTDWDRALRLLDERRGDTAADAVTLALLTGPLGAPMASAR